jgi:hypothetical protein
VVGVDPEVSPQQIGWPRGHGGTAHGVVWPQLVVDGAQNPPVPPLGREGAHECAEAVPGPSGGHYPQARPAGAIRDAAVPDLGITGNSHMLMMDKNNLQVADVLLDWIDSHVGKREKE